MKQQHSQPNTDYPWFPMVVTVKESKKSQITSIRNTSEDTQVETSDIYIVFLFFFCNLLFGVHLYHDIVPEVHDIQ